MWAYSDIFVNRCFGGGLNSYAQMQKAKIIPPRYPSKRRRIFYN